MNRLKLAAAFMMFLLKASQKEQDIRQWAKDDGRQ
ncbi:hypothetical protein BACPU_28280 [Bacillus pumilus]|nr:hypothetical protein BACPU_28280 [Bacillus pumilus]